MRYMDKISFFKETESKYDYELGEHVKGVLEETELEVNITDLGSERSIKLFGDIQENAKVIRLQPIQEALAFDYVVIESKTFKPMKTLFPLNRKTYIVKEFQNV